MPLVHDETAPYVADVINMFIGALFADCTEQVDYESLTGPFFPPCGKGSGTQARKKFRHKNMCTADSEVVSYV